MFKNKIGVDIAGIKLYIIPRARSNSSRTTAAAWCSLIHV